MKCPSCGNMDSSVTDTRRLEDGAVIRRRRICDGCKTRFVTYERLEYTPLSVIKRSGRREIFDRNKIMAGVMRSCNKRNISPEQIEAVVSDVESECLAANENVIEAWKIGELVMKRLKELDEVCYIRFAAVYKQFNDVDTFLAEITGLIKEKNMGAHRS